MKTRTEAILVGSKFLALIGGIWFSILCGSQLLTLVSSFINLNWSKHTMDSTVNLFSIREKSVPYFMIAMGLTIAVYALKALIWYVVYELLLKLSLQNPFSKVVEKKLELIAFLILGVWIVSSMMSKTFMHYLNQETGIQLTTLDIGDEYLFMAGIIYIISQIFKRGIELQQENDLTV